MAIFEDVTDTVRVANAPTRIGVVTHGDRALLVDSGLDENLARKVVNALANEGVQVAGVVNTHAHADHFGGNHFVVKRTGARVVAPAYEHVFLERPDLEPWSLFGAPGPNAMRGKFLLAAASPVDEVVHEEGEREVAGFRVRFHSLPGHSVHQMAIEVDGVAFLGDALLPGSILEKYGVPFAVDPLQQRESVRRVPKLGAQRYVTYHGGVLEDVQANVDVNARAIDDTERLVLRLLEKPSGAEDLFSRLVDELGWTLTPEQYQLNFSTVKAYLSALERTGRASCRVEGGRLLWQPAG